MLVNAKDVRQLSDAMNILIEDENLRKELEVNAKKCYMEELFVMRLPVLLAGTIVVISDILIIAGRKKAAALQK